MSKEYVEREVISEGIRKYYYKNPPNSSYQEGFDRGLDKAQRVILDAPVADVVEVVRCRECVHWKPIGSKAGNSFSDMEYIGGCEFTKYCRRESDFCSYGERKGGADNG